MATDPEEPFVTDDTIELRIPAELAAKFVREESWMVGRRRGYALLQFGTTDLGYWRIDGVATTAGGGDPHVVATLRRVHPE